MVRFTEDILRGVFPGPELRKLMVSNSLSYEQSSSYLEL